jgi:hypothetical protein
MSASAGTRLVYDSVEDALYAVGHYANVPLKTQAARLGMPAAKLNDLVDANRKPRFPAELVAPHAKAAEDFAAVRTICRDAGGMFIQIPTGFGDSREVVSTLGEALKEAGDVAIRVGGHLTDGTLNRLEARDSIPDVEQAVAAMAKFLEILKQKAEAK